MLNGKVDPEQWTISRYVILNFLKFFFSTEKSLRLTINTTNMMATFFFLQFHGSLLTQLRPSNMPCLCNVVRLK